MSLDRRPAKGGSARQPTGGGSSRQPARSSARRPAPESSGRSRPSSGRTRGREEEDGEAEEISLIKKVLFFGTLVLVPIVLGLLVWRGTREEPKPPPKPAVIDHTKIVTEVEDMAKDAAVMFSRAMKQTSDEDKVKGIRAAKEKLSAAQEKLEELSGRKEYQGPDYDAVFEPQRNRMAQEMKAYHEALKRYIR